jgi:hypothetical protein
LEYIILKNIIFFVITFLSAIITSHVYAGCCSYVTGHPPTQGSNCVLNVESEEACIEIAKENKGGASAFYEDETLVCKKDPESSPGLICGPPEETGCCEIIGAGKLCKIKTEKECKKLASELGAEYKFFLNRKCKDKKCCPIPQNLAKTNGEQCIIGCPCGPSSLIDLNKFIATPTKNGILLNWETKTELDSQGFRMWRAIPNLTNYCGCSGNIDDYTQIQVLDKEGKPILIPAKGNETSGFDYSYLDKDAKPGIAYCYALEDVDSKGESKFYFEYVAFTQDNVEETE